MVLVIEKVEPGRQFTEQLLKKLTGVLTPYELPKETFICLVFRRQLPGKLYANFHNQAGADQLDLR